MEEYKTWRGQYRVGEVAEEEEDYDDDDGDVGFTPRFSNLFMFIDDIRTTFDLLYM